MSARDDAAMASVECLAERIASIPEALRLAAHVQLPRVDLPPRTIVTTGIGASEGPSRLLACALAEAGVAARFVPFTAFAVAPQSADLLVVFSQNLSPNARLALGASGLASGFRARWLVTSAGYAPGVSAREALVDRYRAEGVVPIVVPPKSEDGMLLRVVGPAVASLVALRIAALLSGGSGPLFAATDAADAYVAPSEIHALNPHGVALVAAGVSVECLHGHRWKLLEALLLEDPSVWDVLQIAHGPLQAIHEREMTLLVLGTERANGLVSRLQAALSPQRHRLVLWTARRDDALLFFEHAAAIDACLLATLRRHPRNLFDWPGRGGDGPLYNLGS